MTGTPTAIAEVLLAVPDAPDPDGLTEETYRRWLHEQWEPWTTRAALALALVRASEPRIVAALPPIHHQGHDLLLVCRTCAIVEAGGPRP